MESLPYVESIQAVLTWFLIISRNSKHYIIGHIPSFIDSRTPSLKLEPSCS
jgi:hypothetical protein